MTTDWSITGRFHSQNVGVVYLVRFGSVLEWEWLFPKTFGSNLLVFTADLNLSFIHLCDRLQLHNKQTAAYLHIQQTQSKYYHPFGVMFRVTWWIKVHYLLSLSSDFGLRQPLSRFGGVPGFYFVVLVLPRVSWLYLTAFFPFCRPVPCSTCVWLPPCLFSPCVSVSVCCHPLL